MTSRSRYRCARAASAAAVLVCSQLLAGGNAVPSGSSLSWIGASTIDNLWVRESNWSNTGLYPFGPGSTATIRNNDASIHSLNLNVDNLILQDVALSGIGTLTANVSMNISSTGTINNFISELHLRNLGTANFSTGGLLTTFGPTIENAGTFNLGDVGMLNFVAPLAPLINTGLFQKSSGSGFATIETLLRNTGTVRASSGTLQLGAGLFDTFTNSGTFISDSGTLHMSRLRFGNGTNFRGAGISYLKDENRLVETVTVANGARLFVTGFDNHLLGTMSIDAGGVFELGSTNTPGQLSGGGTISGAGTFVFSGGSLFGGDGMNMVNHASMHITSPAGKSFDTGRFTNTATAVWDDGNITSSQAHVITNTGTFDIRSDNQWQPFFFGAGQIVNSGTLKKTAGTGTTFINIDLQNTGTISATSGLLRLVGVSSNSTVGGWVQSSTGAVRLENHQLITGLSFRGSTPNELGDSNVIVGSISVAGDAQLSVMGQSSISNGTISVAPGGTLSILDGGRIAGHGVITGPSSSLVVLSGGTIKGPDDGGTDVLTLSAPITVNSTSHIAGGRITNIGTITWDSGVINTSFGPQFSNNGTFNIRSSDNLVTNFAPPMLFTNSGTLLKSAGGSNNFGAEVFNTGRILLNTGSVIFSQNFTSNGTLSVAAGASIGFANEQTTIAGQQFWPGGFVFTTGSTTTNFASDAGTNGANLTIDHNSGALVFTSNQHLAGLQTIGNVVIAPAGNRVVSTKSLVINGFFPSIDVTNNNVIVDYIGASPLDDIRTRIVNGYNGGSWTGFGINSSAAAATARTAVGYAEASSVFSAFPAMFAGESVDATTVLLRYTLQGDTNLDRVVNITDFARLAANFNTAQNWSGGDFNYDGNANISDFALLAANFNQSLPADLPRSTVPEPACALLVMLTAAMNRHRRCH